MDRLEAFLCCVSPWRLGGSRGHLGASGRMRDLRTFHRSRLGNTLLSNLKDDRSTWYLVLADVEPPRSPQSRQ